MAKPVEINHIVRAVPVFVCAGDVPPRQPTAADRAERGASARGARRIGEHTDARRQVQEHAARGTRLRRAAARGRALARRRRSRPLPLDGVPAAAREDARCVRSHRTAFPHLSTNSRIAHATMQNVYLIMLLN